MQLTWWPKGIKRLQCIRSQVQFPALARIFTFAFLFGCCCDFTFSLQKYFIYMNFWNSFCNFNSRRLLNILHNLWGYKDNRPSIFKVMKQFKLKLYSSSCNIIVLIILKVLKTNIVKWEIKQTFIVLPLWQNISSYDHNVQNTFPSICPSGSTKNRTFLLQ